MSKQTITNLGELKDYIREILDEFELIDSDNKASRVGLFTLMRDNENKTVRRK